MRIRRSLLILALFISISSFAQNVSDRYLDLQAKLAQGWNTWSYESMLNHVLLPEGLSFKLNFRQAFIGTPGDPRLVLDRTSPDTTGLILPIAHTYDGSYTELLINNWQGNTIRVQTAAVEGELVILVTPESVEGAQYQIDLIGSILWNRQGQVKKEIDRLVADLPNQKITFETTGELIDSYHPYAGAYISIKGGKEPVAMATISDMSLVDVQSMIATAKTKYERQAEKFGDLANAYKGIQSVLGWNTLYDPMKNRVLSPVTRGWNEAWQGYVLFNWDTYFAAWLFALDNKDLAYSNALTVTKWPHENGNIGQFQMADGTVSIISQPPVGSTVIWKIYEKYQEKWFLEEVYDELKSWNNWWLDYRVNQGYLSWGGWKGADRQIAAWESGLDNSPMYDGIQMIEAKKSSLLDLADVGLMAMYVKDCQSLARIASALGLKSDAKQFQARAGLYSEMTLRLWNAKDGIFQNKEISSGEFNPSLSPTLFYPMMAGIPGKDQVKDMIDLHYLNEEEFYGDFIIPSCAKNDPKYDNDYWKGAIWGPMNYLVYLGLKKYRPALATDLAQKSFELFDRAWSEHGAVLENINSKTGVSEISDQVNADPFYHWGALMGIMKFEEEGWYQPESVSH